MPSTAPDGTEVFRPQRLGWGAGLLVAPVLCGAWLLLVPQPPFPRWAGAALIGLDLLLAGVLIGRRGRNAVELSARGLRVTHDAGVHQLEWSDVRSAERTGTDDDLVLVTHSGARVVVELDGYAEADRAAIWRRVRQAGLASAPARTPAVP